MIQSSAILYRTNSLNARKAGIMNDDRGMILRHICEGCGKEEIIGREEAYGKGWDYPPKMGKFKLVSPRTCGKCSILTTL